MIIDYGGIKYLSQAIISIDFQGDAEPDDEYAGPGEDPIPGGVDTSILTLSLSDGQKLLFDGSEATALYVKLAGEFGFKPED